MKPTLFDAIDVAEKVNLVLPFDGEMEVGETIVSTQVICTIKTGIDAAPQNTLLGSAVVMAATFEVIQRIQGQVAPVTYKYKCIATLSSGRVLVRVAELPVFYF